MGVTHYTRYGQGLVMYYLISCNKSRLYKYNKRIFTKLVRVSSGTYLNFYFIILNPAEYALLMLQLEPRNCKNANKRGVELVEIYDYTGAIYTTNQIYEQIHVYISEQYHELTR